MWHSLHRLLCVCFFSVICCLGSLSQAPAAHQAPPPYEAGRTYRPGESVTFKGLTFFALSQSENVEPSGKTRSGEFWRVRVVLPGPAFGASAPANSALTSVFRAAALPAQAAEPGWTLTDPSLANVIFGAYNATPTGDLDSVFGVYAGQSLTTAREMTVLGAYACQNFSATSLGVGTAENGLITCIGSQAGNFLTDGIDDVFIGQKAMENAKYAGGSVAIGNHAMTAASYSDGDTVVGAATGNVSVGGVDAWLNNTMIGKSEAIGYGDKTDNTLVGAFAAFSLGNAYENTAVGTYSAMNLTTGVYNTTLGSQSAPGLNAGSMNLILGAEAGPSGDSDMTTMIGVQAGANLTSTRYSTAVGFGTLSHSTQAFDTTVMGFNAGSYYPSVLNGVTLIGSYSGPSLTTASDNTFMGYKSGQQVSTGSGNVLIGNYSGGSLIGGGSNVAVGAWSGTSWTGGESGDVAIGAWASTGAGTVNAVQIGAGNNLTSNSIQWGNRTLVDGNGDTIIATGQPVSSSSPCTTGAFRTAGGYLYLCISTNHWMRSPLQDF